MAVDIETVWLTQAEISVLFDRERSVITKHINNVFKEGELERDSVCAIFARTADDKNPQNQLLNQVIMAYGENLCLML
ncbi:MAG: hypothetical protein ACRCVV_12040 [Shewanella sp.]